MINYKLTFDAKSDLRRIYNYGLEKWGTNQADRYYNNLFDKFEEIAESPYLYMAVDDIREGYRRSVCGMDNIYYRVVDNIVEIMNILGRQDVDEIF